MTENQHSRRDGESLIMLGGFITLLAIPVLIGTAFAERQHAMIVNVASGLVLGAIGVAFIVQGVRTLRRKR